MAHLDVSDSIATLILDAEGSVLRRQDWEQIGEAVQTFNAQSELSVLVVTSSKADFCLGADVSDVRFEHANADAGAAFRRMTRAVLETLSSVPKPTIAVLRGGCRGGGCAVATACDIRIGDDTTYFEISAAAMGLVYPLVSTRLLVDVVGPSCAKRLLLEAARVEAHEALRLRLLDELVAPNELELRAMALATRVGGLPAASHRAHKEFVARIAEGRRAEAAETRDVEAAGYSTVDFVAASSRPDAVPGTSGETNA